MTHELTTHRAESFHARTNAELFRPQGNTGNPLHDFNTHYSRLSGLQRLTLERHTVNGNQISRYEPDITHSTAGVCTPGFVACLQQRARDILGGAALVLTLSAHAPTLAATDCVQKILRDIDLDAVADAQGLLDSAPTAPEFPALANAFAARLNLRPTADERHTNHSQEVKIAAPEYAARRLGNAEDAAEFVRCLRLIAGADASALYTQQLASHYYAEAKRRPANEVLKEMALLGLELSAVTATNEQLEFADEEAALMFDDDAGDAELFAHEAEQLSPSECRTRWFEYAARVLGEAEAREHVFADEPRAQTRSIYRKQAGGFAHDEFAEHMGDLSAATADDDEFGVLLDSFERAYEQYDEGAVVSLHMTDGERKIACGDLDEDTDADSLPECVRHLADELRDLYTSGFPATDRGETSDCEGTVVTAYVRDFETRERELMPTVVYGIDAWLDARMDEAFGGRVTRTMRRLVQVPEPQRPPHRVEVESVESRVVETEETRRGETIRRREMRHFVRRQIVIILRSRLHEQIEAVEVCPNPDERAEARAVLEVLLTKLKTDNHTRGLNQSLLYRELTARLDAATDTATLAGLKKEAWSHKEAGRLPIKLFTALNTYASAHQARLDSEPLREMRSFRVVRGDGFRVTQTFADSAHEFIVAQPLLNRIPTLTGKTLNEFARSLHALPRQEQERVRRRFRDGNTRLYARVRDGLRNELERASVKKLRYFRWAFYAGNKPEHPVHTLTREDQAAAWELLKARSQSGATIPAAHVTTVTTPSVPATPTRTSQPRNSATQPRALVRVSPAQIV